jgi:hypothetical protein
VLDRAGAPALGAHVTIDAAGRKIQRDVAVCSSYCSSNDPRVHCGLGNVGAIVAVTVRWLDGAREMFGPITVDKIETLRQGAGRPAQ